MNFFIIREVIDMARQKKTTSSSSGAVRATASRPAKAGAGPKPAAAPVSHQRIEMRAYYKSEQRGFSPGMELQDWLEAESEESRELEEA
jgi:hypothetical protein